VRLASKLINVEGTISKTDQRKKNDTATLVQQKISKFDASSGKPKLPAFVK
jgi:hypothetical protein